MKLIKYFEDVNKNDYYTKIESVNRYQNNIKNTGLIPFAGSQVSRIKEFIESPTRKLADKSFASFLVNPPKTLVTYTTQNVDMDIIHNQDEWFWIIIGIRENNRYFKEIYRCDQFDGLMVCLNDLRSENKI